MTMVLLFLPKVLSLILILIWIKDAAQFGGNWKVAGSVLIEMMLSVLLAPVRTVYHIRFVLAAFFGWAASWQSPQRDDDSTPWSEAVVRHGPQSLLGLAWAVIVFSLNPGFLLWLSPIVVSLMLAVPISVFSSRVTLGERSRAARWFLIPEEVNVPRELRDTYAFTDQNRSVAMSNGFARAVIEPVVNAVTRAMGRIRHRPSPALSAAVVRLCRKQSLLGPQSCHRRRN